MNIGSRLVLIAVLSTNLLTAMLVGGLCNFMITKTVFNLDAIREDYIRDARYFYIRGCTAGADYPPEFRESKTGFNMNSPTMWCNDAREGMEQEFESSTYHLGRRNY